MKYLCVFSEKFSKKNRKSARFRFQKGKLAKQAKKSFLLASRLTLWFLVHGAKKLVFEIRGMIFIDLWCFDFMKKKMWFILVIHQAEFTDLSFY